MEIDDVRAFVAVADAGSVSAAARELFRTQPAVTRRLQRLERALGTRLVDRRRRPFALTPAGQAALTRCRALLASVQELRAAAGASQGPAGELRVAVAHALTELTLEEPVGRVQRRFPAVRFRLSTGWSRDLLERIRTQSVEAAFLLLPRGEAPPASLRAEALAEERMVVVAPRNEPSSRLTVEALGGRSWLLNPDGCSARLGLERTLARAGLDCRVAIETYDYELQLSLVSQGRGLGLVPGRLLARSRFRSAVKQIRVNGLPLEMTIWGVRSRPVPALEPVLDELTRVVGRHLGRARSRKTAAP
jgi:DNA-binding transcriptional LysR family regulator